MLWWGHHREPVVEGVHVAGMPRASAGDFTQEQLMSLPTLKLGEPGSRESLVVRKGSLDMPVTPPPKPSFQSPSPTKSVAPTLLSHSSFDDALFKIQHKPGWEETMKAVIYNFDWKNHFVMGQYGEIYEFVDEHGTLSASPRNPALEVSRLLFLLVMWLPLGLSVFQKVMSSRNSLVCLVFLREHHHLMMLKLKGPQKHLILLCHHLQKNLENLSLLLRRFMNSRAPRTKTIRKCHQKRPNPCMMMDRIGRYLFVILTGNVLAFADSILQKLRANQETWIYTSKFNTISSNTIVLKSICFLWIPSIWFKKCCRKNVSPNFWPCNSSSPPVWLRIKRFMNQHEKGKVVASPEVIKLWGTSTGRF